MTFAATGHFPPALYVRESRRMKGLYVLSQKNIIDSPEAFNDIENPNRVAPQKTILTFIQGAVKLPPHSLTIVKEPLKQEQGADH